MDRTAATSKVIESGSYHCRVMNVRVFKDDHKNGRDIVDGSYDRRRGRGCYGDMLPQHSM